MKQLAIFLDRDGVINYNRNDYVKLWEEFQFLPGALTALHMLAQLEWPIVVVSNQSAVGRGLIARETVEDIHQRMVSTVRDAGGRIDHIFYCPHHPDHGCDCRKPKTGLLVQAQKQLDLDLGRSFMVGDAASDVVAAHSVGCQPILVKTGRGHRQLALLRETNINGYHVSDDLVEAAAWIMHELETGTADEYSGRIGN